VPYKEMAFGTLALKAVLKKIEVISPKKDDASPVSKLFDFPCA